MNLGTIEGGIYTKQVEFSKAVLWKTRELSLTPAIWDSLIDQNVRLLRFTDADKGVWVYDFAQVRRCAEFKQIGQESQYYFPINIRINNNRNNRGVSNYRANQRTLKNFVF